MMNYEQYLTNLEIRAARRAAKIEEARAEFQLFKRHRAEQDLGWIWFCRMIYPTNPPKSWLAWTRGGLRGVIYRFLLITMLVSSCQHCYREGLCCLYTRVWYELK